MASENECFVCIVLPGTTSFVTAGTFQWRVIDRIPAGEFIYENSYIDRDDAVEIDPVDLQLQDTPFKTTRQNGIFGAFRDAMPDFWGRRVLSKQLSRIDLLEFDYLIEGTSDRIGALDFGYSASPPIANETLNQLSDLDRLGSVIGQIATNDTPISTSAAKKMRDLFILSTSIGGARPKTQVLYNGALWLAKFGLPTDFWNHPG